MISLEYLAKAKERLENKISITPLTYDPELDVYLKWENQQKTGSFKVRGALNKILALEPWEQERGLVAASAGNHGLGVAYAAQLVGSKATVFIPANSVKNKEEAMRSYGATVIKVEGGYALAEKEAQVFAVKRGSTWISPYNDPEVIAGQATIGMELIEQIDPFDANQILVPVSGGGLLAGIGMAIQTLTKRPRLVGVQAKNSAYFHSLYHYGSQKGIIEMDSLADGLMGAVERESITIPLARSMLDDFLLVDEKEIEKSIAYAWYRYGEILEGSAAVTIAAIKNGKIRIPKTILVLSGGNINRSLHENICNKWKEVCVS